jgi:hypothetical protein
VLRFAHRGLFDKLGMEHVTLEFHGAGTPIGSSHMWPRGVIGCVSTSSTWMTAWSTASASCPRAGSTYSARLTPGSETYGHGADFWTNRGTTGWAAKRIGRGMPPDSFMAHSTQGQYLVIVPSAGLVVVRLGMAHDRYEDIDGVARLVADAMAAKAK